MRRKLKRIIALVLCVTLIVGIDNFTGFKSIFQFVNNKIITMGATNNKDNEYENIESDEDSAYVEESEADDIYDSEENLENSTLDNTANITIDETVSYSENIVEETTKSQSKNADTISETVARKTNIKPDATTESSKDASAEVTTIDTSENKNNDNDNEYRYDETTSAENFTNIFNVNKGSMATAASDGIQLTEATELEVGGIYKITSYADWTKLSQVSQTSTLEGMTFIVYKRDSAYNDWTLTNLKIGNKDYPFSGTIYSYYSTTTIYTNVVLFDYLSSKAHIGIKDKSGVKPFILSYSANVVAGLANNLVLDKAGCEVNLGGDGLSNYYVKIIKGTVTSATEATGGLFANAYVEDDEVSPEGSTESIYKINIRETGIDISGLSTTLTGKYAGGLIGNIHGDIIVNVISLPSRLTTTTSSSVITIAGTGSDSAAGSLFGRVSNGVYIVFNNTSDITLSAYITGAYYSGGLIGYIEESKLETTKGIIRSGNTRGSYYVGGLIGYANNSSCTISDYTQKNNTYIYQTETGSAKANRSVGGVIGMYYNNSASRNDVVDISYIKSQNKDASEYSNIQITSAHNGYNKVGGIIGIINGGNAKVYIHDINTETETKGENSYLVNMIYYQLSTTSSNQNETGGISGVIVGNNIIIENIVFNYIYNSGDSGCYSNSLSGGTVGDIAARVGSLNNDSIPSKLIVKDVKVLKNYVRKVNNYQGGLFGVVMQSAIALQGNIDLSGVTYVTYSNSSRESTTYALLASFRNRGFIAGYASESLIYLDIGAQYTRPINYDKDGIIKEFDANVVGYVSGTNTNSTYLYCIDDIGNYGSLFKNVEYISEDTATDSSAGDDTVQTDTDVQNKKRVLDITQDMDNIVTGKIGKDNNGNYVIDDIADALRLAVAGNSVKSDGYPRFGGNCFVDDGEDIPSLNTILSKHYLITTDLKLGEAGIHGFVENDDINKYIFTGTFEGVKDSDNNNPVITMDFISKQKYGGLFPSVGNNATFCNLDITGNIFYLGGVDYDTVNNYQVRAGAGSLAAYATGNITIDNVNIYTNIKDSNNNNTTWDNNNMYCYGGMFGYYYPAGGSYECKNSKIATNISTIRHNAQNGGMIGWVYVGTNSTLTGEKDNWKGMKIENCTLSATITADNNVCMYGANNQMTHIREAGLISMISSSYYNVNTTSNAYYSPVSAPDSTYGYITISNLTIDETSIDLSQMTNNNYSRVSGGLLGYAWSCVDVDINNLTVKNSTINSWGYVGGLISFAAGKYNLTNIDIQSLEMSSMADKSGYNNNRTYSGFLIGNGQYAFVTVSNYTLANDGKVTYNNYSNFDEIVGISLRIERVNGNENAISSGGNVDGSYTNGGIVNIIDSDFNSFTNGTYRSYINQVVTNTNKYTRYYYNLFTEDKDWNIPVSGGVGTVSTPEQWMTFHVAAYANSNIRRYFKQYLSNTDITSVSKINITSDLNMNGYSLYPTPLTNSRTIDGNNHTITLYGETISDLETNLNTNNISNVDRNNEDRTTQHYMMHASLFNEVSDTQVIQNIILSGTASNIGEDSGALIAINCYGNITIKNITVADLRISHYSDTRCGLLISHIGTGYVSYNNVRTDRSTNITFDEITTSYSGNTQLPAAAALIGYVGSDDATDVRVTFKNMKVEDEVETGKSQGKVFKYASYVYDYEYTSNWDYNKCYMLYTFADTDASSGNVTYGEEISDGVEYSNRNRDKNDANDVLNKAIQDAKDGKFIPYVFTQRNIYVNPRNGNITEGCGTYEDPYIISNAKQFLTLYLYLTGKNEYDTMFKGTGTTDSASGIWEVVPIGGDKNGALCSEGGVTTGDDDNTQSTTHTTVLYGSTDFPTRDDLRTAYYKISANIKLGEEEDMNDKYIAGEFAGLGSQTYPFAGVIIGTNDSGNYTITLPKQTTKSEVGNNGLIVQEQIEQISLGLIQYMSGGVVKDINIVGEGYSDGAYYNVTDYAGGVVGKIVGGDNIIDNVNVSINVNTYNKHLQSDGTGGISGIGGYVGIIEDGSLILRNIQNKQVVENCSFGDFTNGTVSTYAIYQEYATKINQLFHATASEDGTDQQSVDADTYTGEYDGYVGMLVGRVYDGYIVYEGYSTGKEGDIGPEILRRNELNVSDKYTKTYPLVNGFHIINGKVLDSATSGGRITFTKTDDNNYKAVIKNGEQLEILALALNSDSLSVFYCERNDHDTAYGYKSKCRYASYADVGKPNAVRSTDRNQAVKFDDNKSIDVGYLYPYICRKYFDYTSLSTSGATQLASTAFADNNYEGYKQTISVLTRNETINANNVVTVTNYISNVNKAISDVAQYTTSYELESKTKEADKMFDVSGYDISFRGIGAIYTKTYSDFRANFNGNGNYVKFYIDRSFDDTIMYSGMFNELTYNQKVIDKNTSTEQLVIQNFTIKNSIVYNPNKFSIFENSTTAQTYLQTKNAGTTTCATGGVAGEVKGAWRFENITLARDEAIKDDKITSDISGYKYVGGFIGRISNTLSSGGFNDEAYMEANYKNANDIDFVNCDIKGTNSSTIEVTELGSALSYVWAGYRVSFAGGIVGGIGTNLDKYMTMQLYGDINFEGCDIDGLTITAVNKANMGGLVGMIGERYNSNAYNDSGWGAIGNVTIDGSYTDSQGKVIQTSSKITNMKIKSNNTTEDYSTGGIVGRVEAPRDYKGGEITICNYDLENVDIDSYVSPDLTNKTDNGNYEGTGGVIGYIRAYLIDLDNINILQSNIGNEKLRKYAGGLIGTVIPTGNVPNNYYQYRILNTLNIDNCKVDNTNIKNYNKDCGGFIGFKEIEITNIGSEAVDEKPATTNTVSNSNIVSTSGNVGGMIGYDYGYSMIGHATSYVGYTTNITNAIVYDTTIKTSGTNAGGVVGSSVSGISVKSYLNFKNIVVYGTSDGKMLIQSTSNSGYAGGLLGSSYSSATTNYVMLDMQGYIGVGVKKDTSDNWVDTGKLNTNIRGKMCGGVVGYQLSTYDESYTADIYVANSRIYSYKNNTDAYPETYSGGIFGYRYCSSDHTYRFNTLTVKNNVIFTGTDNVTSYHKSWGSIGCGGIYGYLNINSKSSTYLPYVTLEDNSIGYYDKANANKSDDTWQSVTLVSKDVKLFDATNSYLSYISWDAIDNLSDSNIGNYAMSFGQFVGRWYASANTAQVFILHPEVKTSSTTGSIPVVDVGSNTWSSTVNQSTVTYGTGYPYNYRDYIHIVYIDDLSSDSIYKDISTANTSRKPSYIDNSLLLNNEVEYQFGEFKTIVSEYQNLNDGITNKAEKNYNFITGKRLNVYMPYNDNTTKYSLCTGDNNYYNLTSNLKNEDGTSADVLNGVPVLILDGLDPQAVGDYAAAILTNAGGVSSNSLVTTLSNASCKTLNNFWQITCENAYIDTDGTIKPIDTSNSIFSEHNVSSIQVSKSNRLKLATSLYDEIIQLEGSEGSIYTITLLCYTYTCPVASVNNTDSYTETRTETIYIPVFVKEKVTMNSYIRILSNEEYSLNEATKNGYKDEVHISHDSTYTIYAEFTYDVIRNKKSFKNDKINKSIVFDATVPVINEGTKFTLIDYASGKSYYYTSDGSETDNVIPFSYFKDDAGVGYEQCAIGDDDSENGLNGIPSKMCMSSYTSIGYQENNRQVAGTDKYENIALERFFIIVEPSDVENNSVFYLNVKTEPVDINGKSVEEFFNKISHNTVVDNQGTSHEGIEITCIPGPSISFGGIDDDGYGTDGVTYIKGKISQDEVVQLDANVEVALKDSLSPYWAEKVSGNTIDSANSGKYLEVAVTLLDENNNVVAWPSGTNVSFNGGPKQVLENNLIIYMYKDIESQFAMDSVDNNLEGDCYYYNVNEDADNVEMHWLHKDDEDNEDGEEDDGYYYYLYNATDGKWSKHYTGITEIKSEYLDITNQCSVTLDFSVADIEDYSGKNYTVMMKLYRSDSADYPNEGTTKSYGDVKRQYSGIISGESKRELAAAISADDLIDLGINLYTKSQNIYDIPFTNKFDFSGLIHKSKVKSDIEECANQKYMVTYRLYKKVSKDSSISSSIDTNDYAIGYNENIASVISRSSEYQYEIVDWDDAPFELYDESDMDNPLTSTDITVNENQTQSVIVTTKEFTEEDIENGTSGTKYVTDWGMTLKVDTTDMGNEDLTNYMITATYLPYDSEDSKPDTDEQQTLYDYFVFTLAKLKVDF